MPAPFLSPRPRPPASGGILASLFELVSAFAALVVLFVLQVVVKPFAAWFLPVSIRSRFGLYDSRRPATTQSARPLRVAVIGGGIAGSGAAWALARSGACDVTLYEPRSVLGGNAKTHLWTPLGTTAAAAAAATATETPASARPGRGKAAKAAARVGSALDGEQPQQQESQPKQGYGGANPPNQPPEAVRTGLSVLAWPAQFFRTYGALLRLLRIPTVPVVPHFLVAVDDPASPPHRPGAAKTWCHGDANAVWRDDMHRWDRAVSEVRRVNNACVAFERAVAWCLPGFVSRRVGLAGSDTSGAGCGGCPFDKKKKSAGKAPHKAKGVSLYEVCVFNPLNVVPARFLCRWGFGMSDAFWRTVVVPVYSSSFLTARLDALPAAILPTIDAIISVGTANPLRELRTWQGSSKDVFDVMANEIRAAGRIACGVNISEVRVVRGYFGQESDAVAVTAAGVVQYVDRVVFACPAPVVDAVTRGCPVLRSRLHNPLFRFVVPRVRYENERDANFARGVVHRDRTVLPDGAIRAEITTKRLSNYVRVHGNPQRGNIENTFVLGTWVPAAVAATRDARSIPDFYVTYNGQEGVAAVMGAGTADDADGERSLAVGTVDNAFAHPQFTPSQLALSFGVAALQGRGSAYYCGNYTTPGNGHDLSLLSGFCVASAIIGGGYYPLPASAFENDAARSDAQRDFALLRRSMGL